MEKIKKNGMIGMGKEGKEMREGKERRRDKKRDKIEYVGKEQQSA